MRRKTAPFPLRPRASSRALAPARVTTALPTAAAIALALLGAGCSAPLQDTIAADPVHATPETPAPAASPVPSAIPSAVPSIMPEPQLMRGGEAMVKPPAKGTRRLSHG